MSVGHWIVGGSRSSTVTEKVHWAVCPAAEVAEHFTVVVPMRNTEPEGGSQTTVVGEHASAVTWNVTTAEH